MTPEQEAKIIALCDRIGIPWERAPERDDTDFPWYGHALNLRHSGPSGTSDFVHDIAHWLVAAPARRSDAFFSLDNDAYSRDERGRYVKPKRVDSVAEETEASLLGILIERAMGFNWKYTWRFHNWDMNGWHGLRPIIRALRKRGLIRGLTPTCLLDSTPKDATSATPRR